MKKTGIITHIFQNYYNKIPIPLLVLDIKGEIVYKNSLMDDWFGVDTYKSIYDVIHQEDRDMCMYYFKEGIKLTSSSLSIDARWMRRGKVRYVRLHGSFLEENDEAFIVVTLEDMTGQKEARSLLHTKKSVIEMIVKREPLAYLLQELSKQVEGQISRMTYCSIMLLDESGKKIETVIAPNLPASFSQSVLNFEIKPGLGSCGTAMYLKEKVIVSNIATDPLWQHARHKALSLGLHACWSVPIFIDGEVVGSFALYHIEPASPTAFELEMIEICAYLAGLAIERSRHEAFIIKEQEGRFQALINAIPDSVIFKDKGGRWMDMNEAALEKLPFLKQASYKGKSNNELAQLFPYQKAFFDYCERTDELTWKTGKPVQTECRVPLDEGNMITFDFIKAPIYGSSGIQDGLLVIGRDITEKKKEAIRIEESEQKYKSLFEHNPSGIYSIDVKGKITSFNASLQNMIGLVNEDLGQPLIPFIAPDYIERTLAYVKKALNGEAQSYETVAIHQNGSLVYLKVTNIPIVVQGEIVGVYGIAKDITQQKGKEEELRQTKELLESLFQHSADCISILSLDGVVHASNQAVKNVYGWEPDEVRGKFSPIVPEDRLGEMQMVKESILLGKEVVGLETIRKKKDGSLFEVSVTFSPLKDAKGNIIGMTAISRDISERKRTEELISRSDKLSAIGQLAASIAHEIRNPLTSIKGFIQFFRGKIESEFVELMLSELERIELIVTEFLLLAKPHATQFVAKNVNDIIHNTLAIIEGQAIMNKVQLKTWLADSQPIIHCDENKIKQVLINVLQNAMEAMPSGGDIQIHTEVCKDEIVIQVADEGCGISKERIKKLGEPFYSNKEKGTGLGLMVCFKIVEEHGGRIEFKSKEGQGTKVRIYLPDRNTASHS